MVSLYAYLRPCSGRQCGSVEYKRIAVTAESQFSLIFPIGIYGGMRTFKQNTVDILVFVRIYFKFYHVWIAYLRQHSGNAVRTVQRQFFILPRKDYLTLHTPQQVDTGSFRHLFAQFLKFLVRNHFILPSPHLLGQYLSGRECTEMHILL